MGTPREACGYWARTPSRSIDTGPGTVPTAGEGGAAGGGTMAEGGGAITG